MKIQHRQPETELCWASSRLFRTNAFYWPNMRLDVLGLHKADKKFIQLSLEVRLYLLVLQFSVCGC